ncbi:MAG TPA: hypothetical protein VFA43_11860 [Gemmatimonadaceae bacterium]|nr:hypothetical protein [Gemmatimonadaceae bacterium]
MSQLDELRAALLAAAEEDLRAHPPIEITPWGLDGQSVRSAAVAELFVNELLIRNLARIQEAVSEDVASWVLYGQESYAGLARLLDEIDRGALP